MRVRRFNCANREKRHGALLSMEFLFLLPILIIIVWSMVEIAMLFIVETRLNSVSREGVRMVAMGGGSEEVQSAIERVFGASESKKVNYEIDYLDGSSAPGHPVGVTVSTAAGSFVPNYLRYIGFDLKDRTLSARTVMTLE